MKLKFLTDRAMLLEPDRILLLSDLHIGLEREISLSGVTIPSQYEKLKERIDNLIAETKAKHLIFLGDVKHDIPGISWQEFKEIPKLFESFNIKVSVIKGNHDGDIERLIPKNIDIYDSTGFTIKNFAFTHGHAWPSKEALDCEYLIMGHLHPAVEFWTHEFRSVEHCWIKCDVNKKVFEKKYKRKCNLKKGIIMPTFNSLMGGIALNSKDFKPNDPLLRNEALEWKEGEVYLLDGTFLGKLKNIKA